jgi:hypothetical protein
LVVEAGPPDGGSLFVELELTVKGTERRREIVRAYQWSSHVNAFATTGRRCAAGDAADGRPREINLDGELIDLREWWPTTLVGSAA